MSWFKIDKHPSLQARECNEAFNRHVPRERWPTQSTLGHVRLFKIHKFGGSHDRVRFYCQYVFRLTNRDIQSF